MLLDRLSNVCFKLFVVLLILVSNVYCFVLFFIDIKNKDIVLVVVIVLAVVVVVVDVVVAVVVAIKNKDVG